MVTSYFRPKLEIRLFRACAMKNMQYYPRLWPNWRNFRVLKEIVVEEHDGDVRLKSWSGNTAVSCMLNASGHNYRNSSFIVDLAMGQIPRSTERISSSKIISLQLKYQERRVTCGPPVWDVCSASSYPPGPIRTTLGPDAPPRRMTWDSPESTDPRRSTRITLALNRGPIRYTCVRSDNWPILQRLKIKCIKK